MAEQAKPQFMPNQYARCECELSEFPAAEFPICTHFEADIVDGDADWPTDICKECRHGEECHLKGHEPHMAEESPMTDPDISQLTVGQKVHYQPNHYGHDEWENGIIKEIRATNPDAVFVVYNCGGNWDRYQDYTSALTNLRDLRLGWRHS